MPSLTIGNHIGSGAYGAVFHAKWGVRKVAIKRFNLTKDEAKQEAAVQDEISLLERLRDRHIVQFYGDDYHEDKLVLIMDYAEGGSLQSAIKRRQISDWATRTRISHEIAQGLAYIHQEKILHRDLKSGNVLLTRHKEVKLCDFGLAKVKLSSVSGSTATGGDSLKGTFRWMAPELFAARPKYSTKSDMFALGVVMWEMAANNITPFEDQPDNFVVMGLVKSGEREELPEETPDDYRGWVEQLWEQDPKKRPEARALATLLDEVVHGGDAEPGDDEDEVTGDTVSISMDFSDMSISLPSTSTAATSSSASRATTSASVANSSSDVSPAPSATVSLSSSAGKRPTKAGKRRPVPVEQESEDEEPSEADRLVASAEAGDVQAQLALAEMYAKGMGGAKQDMATAFQWYAQAAKDPPKGEGGEGEGSGGQGNADAQNALGVMFYNGRGTMMNTAEAKRWFQKAAEQGHAGAQTNLGALSGIGGDAVEAIKWFRKAAEQGDAVGQVHLGVMLYAKTKDITVTGEEAQFWLEKAAEQGLADGQYYLANFYRGGFGTHGNDDAIIAKLYLDAANQGHREAMYHVGGMFQAGTGGLKQSLENANYWYNKFGSIPPESDILKWPLI
ncbi:hypothetical protein DFQ26_006054 [Actinomortierella ambigua]|nr:hypothetical protein DFQ26_006054 [Actinomortierella ambigua]